MEAARAIAAIPQVSLPVNGERSFSSVGRRRQHRNRAFVVSDRHRFPVTVHFPDDADTLRYECCCRKDSVNGK